MEANFLEIISKNQSETRSPNPGVYITLLSGFLKLCFLQLVESICRVNQGLLRELFLITSSVETYSNHKPLAIFCDSHLAYFAVLHKSICAEPFNQFAPLIIKISQ